jgi:hypothetical protein
MRMFDVIPQEASSGGFSWSMEVLHRVQKGMSNSPPPPPQIKMLNSFFKCKMFIIKLKENKFLHFNESPPFHFQCFIFPFSYGLVQ